jgi:NADH-quinone oxidoreductase subunit G
MCDEGRFGFSYVLRPDRLSQPMVRTTTNGSALAPVEWSDVLKSVDQELRRRASANPRTIAAVFSPFMTCEEAFLLATYLKGVSADIRLAMAPIPVVGADDHYPKGPHGEAPVVPKFTIRAEKCPNKLGVETVLRHFEGRVISAVEILQAIDAADITALWLVGGGPESWVGDEHRPALEKLEALVVEDILPSKASQIATCVLPGAAFAEKEGTYVNHAGLAQSIHWAFRPRGEARPNGRIYLELLGRSTLFNTAAIRREMASAIEELAPLASGSLGENGTRLDLAVAAAT